jgi:thiamine-phosphate pyrophosphorylase
LDELRLTLVTDRTQVAGRDLVAVVGECLAAGLPAVQLREKDLGAIELAGMGRALRVLTAERGALLIVNDRVDVALAVGADAVQRTSTSLPIADILAISDKRLRVGASVHSVTEAVAAAGAGADWLVFGPIYDTPSKRSYGPPQGLGALAATARAVSIPVVAIGGITPERIPELRRAGARGVAVISGILAADSPAAATRRFLAALDAA